MSGFCFHDGAVGSWLSPVYTAGTCKIARGFYAGRGREGIPGSEAGMSVMCKGGEPE